MSTSSVLKTAVASTAATRAPLRVVVILDSLTMPRWIHRILSEIEDSDFASIDAIVLLSGAASVSSSAPRESLLFRAWRRMDEALFRTHSPHPDVFDLALFTPQIHTQILVGVDSTASPDAYVELVAGSAPDVILNLARTAMPKWQSLKAHAEWSFCYKQASSRIFWTLYNALPVVANRIDVSGPNVEGQLTSSYLGADRVSLFRTHTNLCWSRSKSLLRCLSTLYHEGSSSLQQAVQAPVMPIQSPNGSDTVRLSGRVASHAIRDAVKKHCCREEWFVAFREASDSVLCNDTQARFTIIRPPQGRFYADPFLAEWNGRTYIFFENYSYEQRKAVISFVEIDANGNCSQPDLALEENYHLAFPSIFTWQGEIYLLPETKNNRSIHVYRPIDFPCKWEPAAVLLKDISAADSTLLSYGGKLWLFTSGLGTEDPWFDACSELSLFYSDSLSGPWIPHPKNPVVTDIRCARSAGQLYWDRRRLIRPAQDCAGVYGRAVSLQWVDTLSETDYHEVAIGRIDPEWLLGNCGTHTFNRSSKYEVLDGRTLIGRFSRKRAQPSIDTFLTTSPVIRLF